VRRTFRTSSSGIEPPVHLVFMGTPAFAVVQLRACASSHEVAAVYTRPDSASGRGRALRPSPVKQAAEELSIPVRQPVTLRDPAEIDYLTSLAPDVIVVAAYGLILPPQTLAIPPGGCVNVHASLLPRWRGAAPVQRAILAGDDVTGVSTMLIDEGLDTGPIDEIVEVATDELDAACLTEALARAGTGALLRTLEKIESGQVRWRAQDDVLATYADKLTRHDVAPLPTDSVTVVLRKVRASSPQAPSRIEVAGRGLTVLVATTSASVLPPGAAEGSPDGLALGVADGSVTVVRLKPDGGPEMDATAWLRGARLAGQVEWAHA
jgi:methionyl-tRNA formyltransferase